MPHPQSIRRIPRSIPVVRTAAFAAMVAFVCLLARTVPNPRWNAIAVFGLLSLAYAIGTWIVAHRVTAPRRLVFLADRFAELDIVAMTGAIYLTGGHQSWMLPLTVLRAADHHNTGFKRVLWYAHLSTILYLAMLLWVQFGDGVALNWTIEGLKVSLIYACNLYISLTAKTVDRLRANIKRTEQSLRDAKSAAEHANSVKSQFLAAMSHELRTPLNAIIGYTELLREEKDGLSVVERDADLARIEGAGRHLLGLVNQVLDLSKIESGRMEVAFEKFHPGVVAREVVDMLEPLSTGRRNALRFELGEGVAEIEADPAKFRQSLINLVSNACKFTEDGEVSVKVEGVDEEWIGVAVSDTGIGIPADRIGTIFEPFVQGSQAITDKYGGTGLGLALTHKFCGMMGGTLSVESEPGQGSVFRMKIPRKAMR